MPSTWADTVQYAERTHLLLLLTWGVSSVLLGSLTLAWLRSRGWQSALLQQFATQVVLWGMVESTIAFVLWRRIALRDLAGATRLDRMVWLGIGLDIGFVLAGLALIWSGSRDRQRPGLIGTGAGVVLQGAALAALHLTLAAHISR